MKRIFVLLSLLLFVFSSNAIGKEITKNRLYLGSDFDWLLNNGGDSKSTAMMFTIPSINYLYEYKPTDFIKLYLHTDAYFDFIKSSYDGITNENTPTNSGLKIKHKVKFYLPNHLYISLGVISYFTYANPDIDNQDAVTTLAFDVDKFKFGWSDQSTEIHILSPWDFFKDGFDASLWLYQGVFRKVSEKHAVSTADLPTEIGVKLDYAFLNKKAKFMINPWFDFGKQIASDGFEAMKIDFGLLYSQDFAEKFNLCVDGVFNLDKVNDDVDLTKGIDFGLKANYYIIPELLFYAEYDLFLTLEETADGYSHPMSIGLGLDYKFDFLK